MSKANLSRLALISFADGNLGYRNAGRRLRNLALESDFFSTVQVHNLKTLRESTNLYSFEDRNLRTPGLDFWRWKPALLLQSIRDLPSEIDTICYVDAGCTLNYKEPASRRRFMDYVESSHHHGASTFKLADNFLIRKWTKGDVLQRLEVTSIEANQSLRAAGAFLANRKTSKEFAEEWYELSTEKHLFDNSDSVLPNDKNFIEHRHDQSTFSILSIRANHKAFRAEIEPSYIESANVGELEFPIVATRYKTNVDPNLNSLSARVNKFIQTNIP